MAKFYKFPFKKGLKSQLSPLLDDIPLDRVQIFSIPEGFMVKDVAGLSLCYKLDDDGTVVVNFDHDKPII